MTAVESQESFKLNRFLSRPLTVVFLKTPLKPNHITFFSLLFGIFSGVLFAEGRLEFSLLGALSFQIAAVLDNCDGEIARAKNLKSNFGGWFDIIADVITDIALFSGLAVGISKSGGVQWPVFPAAILCICGSLLNFLIVWIEKTRGFGPAVFNQPHPQGLHRKNIFFLFVDALREGDSSWFVMLFALFNKLSYLLWFGAVYMQLLWISALLLNFKWLFAFSLRTKENSK